jgi:hypothetical protein
VGTPGGCSSKTRIVMSTASIESGPSLSRSGDFFTCSTAAPLRASNPDSMRRRTENAWLT